MASEDSDHILPRFLAVHRLRDLRYLDQPLWCEVSTGGNRFHAVRELFKVSQLGRL